MAALFRPRPVVLAAKVGNSDTPSSSSAASVCACKNAKFREKHN